MPTELVPLPKSLLGIDLAGVVSSGLEALEEHDRVISRRQRYLQCCSRCNANSGFKLHDLRRRKLRVIVDLTVRILSVVVARWRCLRCRHNFTDFPPFVLPYRRYASTSLLPLAVAYLEQDRVSYDWLTAPGGRRIGYVTPDGQEKIDERALHRSTLWRWIGFLGGQIIAFQVGLELYTRYDPLTTLHRFVGAVAPHKHRTQGRAEILRTARRLLHLIDCWDRTFSERFFPRFATRARAP